MFVEKLLQKGYEVLFLTEPVDEYMMTHLTEFDDKKFQDAQQGRRQARQGRQEGLQGAQGAPAPTPAPRCVAPSGGQGP